MRNASDRSDDPTRKRELPMNKGLKVPINPAMALRALNSQHAAPPDEENSEYTTILQTDIPTNRPTNTLTNQQTNLDTNKLTDQHTDKQTNKPVVTASTPPPVPPPQVRIDGRTLRVRQETSDRTMVTSMRLNVATIDQLDEFCWKHRQRKQDVIQEALTLYFETMTEQGAE
jgi:hypothetical protein